MVFSNEKTAKFLERSLILIPTQYEKYDANHISLVFFGTLGLHILKKPVDPAVAQFVDGLWVGNGYKGSYSYGGGDDERKYAHLPSTYFCLGIRQMLGLPPLSKENRDAVRAFIPQCQLPNGLFRATAGEGEASIRHSYTAHAILRLLDLSEGGEVPEPEWVQKSINYILSCQNYEGGMGDSPDEESHLGLTYCAIACLKMHNAVNRVPSAPLLTKFLAQCQQTDGGYHGRPNKPADVCYSFWALGTLDCLGLGPEICSPAAAADFLTTTGYDDMLGGFWKTVGAHADPYHTALALCALSILDAEKFKLSQLDAVLCLPAR